MLEHRPILNNSWIENQQEEIQIMAADEFHSRNIKKWTGWLEREEEIDFQEAFNNRSPKLIDEWYTWHEYEEVITHTCRLLKERLEEQELFNVVPTEEQIDDVRQAVLDTGMQLADLHAISWYNFLKQKEVI